MEPRAIGALQEIQRTLEQVYLLEVELGVEECLLDEESARRLAALTGQEGASLREAVYVRLVESDIQVGIYLGAQVHRDLQQQDPRRALHRDNLGAFLVAVEEVSHFLCIAWHTQQDRPYSHLELEVQAEVDKFVMCALYLLAQGRARGISHLLPLLFDQCVLRPQVGRTERSRYVRAARFAVRYCHHLQRLHLAPVQAEGLLRALRQFYRLGHLEKIRHIESLEAA